MYADIYLCSGSLGHAEIPSNQVAILKLSVSEHSSQLPCLISELCLSSTQHLPISFPGPGVGAGSGVWNLGNSY